MRKAIVTPILAGIVAVGTVAAAPIAAQASAGPTTTTFGVTGGSLSITTPTSVNIGSVAAGAASISGSLGTVTVTDQRANLLGSWATSVISGAFTTGGATANETIAASNVGYTPGATTAKSGLATFTAGSTGLSNISTAQTAYTASGELGVTSVSWAPNVSVTLPSTTVAGTYTGTITHSVA
jgi:hypothetical protein